MVLYFMNIQETPRKEQTYPLLPNYIEFYFSTDNTYKE